MMRIIPNLKSVYMMSLTGCLLTDSNLNLDEKEFLVLGSQFRSWQEFTVKIEISFYFQIVLGKCSFGGYNMHINTRVEPPSIPGKALSMKALVSNNLWLTTAPTFGNDG